MKYFFLTFVILALFQDVPLKPKEEFEIKLGYEFKNRPAADVATVHFDETRKENERRTSTTPLPFLTLNVKMLTLSADETKMKITNNLNAKVATRKVEVGTVIPILIGFTDDAKDRVSAHEYTLTLLSAKKVEVSKIVIFIDQDGTFLVNGEKRGKF